MKSKNIAFALLALVAAFCAPIHAQTPNPALATPAPLTPAQATAAQIGGTAQRSFNQLLSDWKMCVALVWKNPQHLTPQQVFTALGTNGGPLIDAAQKTQAYLESLRPGCTADTAALIKAHTVNGDGTVTVN